MRWQAEASPYRRCSPRGSSPFNDHLFVKRRMFLWPLLAVVVSVLVIVVAILALYVDDWQRDLSQNHAATVDDPKAPLAAFRSDLPPAELANHVIAATGKLPGWKLDKLDEGNAEVTIRFIRATGIMRFRDDITVRISPLDEGSILRAESQSRIGKGDLGQNPRNLRELLTAVAKKDNPPATK